VNGIQLINKEMRLKSKAAHPQQKSKQSKSLFLGRRSEAKERVELRLLWLSCGAWLFFSLGWVMGRPRP